MSCCIQAQLWTVMTMRDPTNRKEERKRKKKKKTKAKQVGPHAINIIPQHRAIHLMSFVLPFPCPLFD